MFGWVETLKPWENLLRWRYFIWWGHKKHGGILLHCHASHDCFLPFSLLFLSLFLFHSFQASSFPSMSKPNYAGTARTGQTNSISSVRRNDGWSGSEEEKASHSLEMRESVRALFKQVLLAPLMWRERTNWSINFMYTSVRTFPSADF